jgi:alkylation response protein AidB-like acyl-CoA dehydrogenase
MQFDLSDEQIALRNHVRPFAAQQLAPSALEWDREGQFPPIMLRHWPKPG